MQFKDFGADYPALFLLLKLPLNSCVGKEGLFEVTEDKEK